MQKKYKSYGVTDTYEMWNSTITNRPIDHDIIINLLFDGKHKHQNIQFQAYMSTERSIIVVDSIRYKY